MKLYFDLRINKLTQKFGENKLPIYKEWGLKGHNGLDLRYYHSELIAWPCNLEGKVIRTEIDSSGGIGVDVLVNDNGFYYKLRFWHLKAWDRAVGDKIETGQLFTRADNTGVSTGSHLHFGLKPVEFEQGRWVNKLQNNLYFGAIDPMPFVINTNPSKVLEIQTQIIKVIQKAVGLLKQYIKENYGR